MSFTHLSPLAFWAGLAGIAAALFLLQRLTVRHREVPVVTTLFWKEAVEETRARIFVQRFRHPWTYVFLLAIGAALWLALADPVRDRGDERDLVLLLDGSAVAARTASFDASAQALGEAARELPRERTTVLFVGGTTRTLLLPDELPVLLERRLAALAPESAPSRMDSELLRIAGQAQRPTGVIVYGAAPVSDATYALLPASIDVRHAAPVIEPSNDQGITALGASPAASGRWSAVDVLVEVRGTTPDAQLAAALDGSPVAVPSARETTDAGQRIVFRDVPASGGTFEVRLTNPDGFAANDTARLVLPDRPPIRVRIAPSLTDVLGPALAADPAVVIDETGDADVVVRRSADPDTGLPFLELVPQSDQHEAFLVSHDVQDSDTALDEALEALGLFELDARGLATERGLPVAVGVVGAAGPNPVRGVSVWDSLLEPDGAFIASRGFPLFVARTVRWLADVTEMLPTVAAGEALAGSVREAGFVDEAGARFDPAGLSFHPPVAGTYRSADDVIAASLLDSSLPDFASSPDAAPVALGDDPARASSVILLLLLALAALAVEWRLHRAGRIP